MRPRSGAGSDDGATLIEVLVAVAIVGVAFATIVGGMYTVIVASDANRKQAGAATHLTSYAEAVKADAYVDCATTYAGAGFALPSGFTKGPVTVAYWNAASLAFDAACGSDSGLQRVTLSIRSDDSRAVFDVQLAKRRP